MDDEALELRFEEIERRLRQQGEAVRSTSNTRGVQMILLSRALRRVVALVGLGVGVGIALHPGWGIAVAAALLVAYDMLPEVGG